MKVEEVALMKVNTNITRRRRKEEYEEEKDGKNQQKIVEKEKKVHRDEEYIMKFSRNSKQRRCQQIERVEYVNVTGNMKQQRNRNKKLRKI